MLEVFIEKFPFPDQVLGVEIPFSVDLHDPVTGELLPAPMIGAVDAIVKYGDDVTLIELKTGKRRWSQDLLELDPQLTAYRMGCRVLGINNPRLQLAVSTKAKKPDVQIEDLVRHERDERELVELAVGVLRAAEGGVDVRVRGWQCKTCGYQTACSP